MFRTRIMLLSVLALFLTASLAFGQLAYSPFTDGTVAYVALTGPGVNFARGNPAALTEMKNRRISLSTEHNLQIVNALLKSFSLQVQATSRLALAVSRWERTATTGAFAHRWPWDAHPLRFIDFGYNQNWSIGAGLRLTRNFSLGAAWRDEEYSATSLYSYRHVAKKGYEVFDFGALYVSQRFNLGVVYRGWRSDPSDDASDFEVTHPLPDGSTLTWKPVGFPHLQFAPREAWEAGLMVQAHERVQVLGDVSSREEFALGVRLHVLQGLALTAGRGERDDRIYNVDRVRYNALGAQYHFQRFAFAVAWIIPQERARNHHFELEYGRFEFRPLTNHQLQMGVNVSL